MSERFLLDENIPQDIVNWMILRGHDVLTASEAGLSGKDDATVYDYAVREGRILVTLDQDFANPVAYPPGPGRVVLYAKRMVFSNLLPLMERLFSLDLDLKGVLWFVSSKEVRSWSEPGV